MNLDDPYLLRVDPVAVEARAWLKSDGLMFRLLEAVEQPEALEGCLIGESDNAVQLLLECVNRISCLFEGATSAGKNTIVDSVIRVLPDNHVRKVTALSKRALRWWPEDKAIPVLYIAELESLATGEESSSDFDIKLTISEGGLTFWVPEKGESGKMETVEKHITVNQFIITTAEVNVPPQLKNRLEKHHAKDSQSQTASVRDEQLLKATLLKGCNYSKEVKVAKFVMGVVLQNTKDLKVVIPYAQALASILTDERTETRRQTIRLLDLIRASAKLHYLTRPKIKVDGEAVVLATVLDLAIVLGVCGENLRQELGAVDSKMHLVLDVCRKLELITVPNVTKQARADKITELYSASTVGEIFRALREKGILIQKVDEDGKEKKAFHGARIYDLASSSADYMVLDHSEILAAAWAETSRWHQANAIRLPLEDLLGSIQTEDGLMPIGAAETNLVPPAPLGTTTSSDSMLPRDRRGVRE